MKHRLTSMFFVAALLAGAAQAQSQQQKIAGDVVKLDGTKLEVKATSGQVVDVKVADSTRVSARVPADASKLVPGAFVGTAAVPQPDGTLLAREVHVFPEAMRGTGEGHRPMETDPGSTMTNATIASMGGHEAAKGNTMTNATVASVTGVTSKKMTLTYKGGEKVVVVPKDVPVVTVEPADRSALVPGAHVIVYAQTQPDGTLAAERVSVGKNGSTPPV
jgi:hypothetical protein